MSIESEVLLLEQPVFRDDRGTFRELWRNSAGTRLPQFVQDNCSVSRAGVLRGLHFQYERPQGKLVSVLAGRIYDVAVDIRPDSPTFGQSIGYELAADNGRQLYIPEGFAHGFQALEDSIVHYKCTDYFVPTLDGAVLWNDDEIGIQWPIREPVLSAKDAAAPALKTLDAERLRLRSHAGSGTK